MKKTEYEKKRAAMMAQAQQLINDGKIEEANQLMDEIRGLDERFENAARAQANLRAMNEVPAPIRLENLSTNEALDMNQEKDITNSAEYRSAFMGYVLSGKEMPEKLKNAAGPTKTSDLGVLIPTVIVERIVEKMEATGMILPLVTRTSYKGGVKIPKSTVKPEASWVAEGATSPKQKLNTSGTIDFTYNKLRCAVSITLEVDEMALSVFESQIVNSIAKAMVKALEQSIISGDGNGKPKGILTETAADGQELTIDAKKGISYQTLIDAEAAIPLAYENDVVWNMTKKTFMAFEGMVDANGQPIAKTNYGISGKPERVLLGRTVVLNEYMPSYTGTAPTENTTVAFLFNWSDYMLNTNLGITAKTYEDEDTDDQVAKAIMLVDGKAIDINSLVKLTAAKATTQQGA